MPGESRTMGSEQGETMQLGVMASSVVRELANIGLAHATTAMAELTGKNFDMEVPEVESVALERLPSILGDPHGLTVATYMSIDGDVGGHIAFLMPWISAQQLWLMLVGNAPDGPEDVTDLHASVALEVGNMVNSGLLNSISDMTGLSLHATPPQVSMDMTAAVVASIVCEASFVDSVALSIQTEISDSHHRVTGFFVYIPTVGGLRSVFRSLGVLEAA
jgi:chemotaxis protein CheC